jgi:hypothetical protein
MKKKLPINIFNHSYKRYKIKGKRVSQPLASYEVYLLAASFGVYKYPCSPARGTLVTPLWGCKAASSSNSRS